MTMNGMLFGMPELGHGRSRAINAENPTGEKGRGGMASSVLGKSRKGSPCLRNIKSGDTVVLADIKGCGVITHIWFTLFPKTTDADCFVFRDLVLRMYWDGEEAPSVEVPLGDFFCCGFGKECKVTSMPILVLPVRGFNSYFAMPFRTGAKITIENQHRNTVPEIFYQIDYNLYDALPEHTEYFHAQWRRQPITTKGEDYVVLDGVKGRGTYIGTYLALQTLERYWWGEGEMKFYIDGDTEYPTICGTGTEDYFGGSYSFAHQENGRTVEETYSTLFMGYPYCSNRDDTVHNEFHNDDVPPMRGFYRFHIPDPIYFEQDLKVTLQQIGVGHGGLFERQDDVTTVAYWYQEAPHAPFPPLPGAAERRPR